MRVRVRVRIRVRVSVRVSVRVRVSVSVRVRVSAQTFGSNAVLRGMVHGSGGCGAAQRSIPTGGAAKGMLRKTRKPVGKVWGITGPCFVVQTSVGNVNTSADRTADTTVANKRCESHMIVGRRFVLSPRKEIAKILRNVIRIYVICGSSQCLSQ